MNFLIEIRNVWFKGLVSLLIAGLLGSCLREIELSVPEANLKSVAIRGFIQAGDTAKVEVKITYISNYKAFELPKAIPNAVVTVLDETGGQLLVPMRSNGDYEIILREEHDFRIEPGKSYRLSVVTPEGKRYQSTMEVLQSVPKPEKVTQLSEIRTLFNSAGNSYEQEYLQFQINTSLSSPGNPGGTFLKWSFSGTYKLSGGKICYIDEPLNLENVVIFNGRASRQNELTDFYLLEEPYDYRFYEGYYLTVRQQSLSEEAYHYWEQIGRVVNRTGGIFEAPAGKVQGNIYNMDDESEEVFGYFYATEEAIIRYKVSPGISYLRHLCFQVGPPANPYCGNCLAHPRSSLDKPDYWE